MTPKKGSNKTAHNGGSGGVYVSGLGVVQPGQTVSGKGEAFDAALEDGRLTAGEAPDAPQEEPVLTREPVPEDPDPAMIQVEQPSPATLPDDDNNHEEEAQ